MDYFWLVLAIINIPIYIIVGKLILGDFNEFLDAIGFWLQPDIISRFRDEYWEDVWAEMKLGLFIIVCVGLVIFEHNMLIKYLANG